MSNWVSRTNRRGLEYGGSAHNYYWNYAYNPNATYANCMANCTTYAYGRILEAGDPKPVSVIRDAKNWPSVLTNGWTAVVFNPAACEPGDLLIWNANHVAVVEYIEGNVVHYSQSSYTGDHGVAMYGGSYDRRTPAVMGPNLQSVSNWMIANYPSRFFSMNNTNNWRPDIILKNPMHHSGGGPGPGPEPPGPGPEPGPEPKPIAPMMAALLVPLINRAKKKVRIKL